MAFGESGPNDGATVKLNVDISEVSRLETAEREWRETVGSMSREALKLDLANDRLRKSLSSYGAESAQAKRATIALREAEESATRAASNLGRAHDTQRRSTLGLTRAVASYASIFLGGYGLIGVTKLALNASSNLAEQVDFSTRIFGSASPIVEDYARNALGLARDQAYEAAAGIGSLITKFTDSDDAAAKTSVSLTKLAVDLASIKNTRVDEALTAIRSGLVGESEPLRRYAVLLSAARVEQVALQMTGKKSAEQLTEGEKVLARVNLITREAAYAQGNYADTIESTANQEREAQKNLRNTAILIGDTLQPAYRELLSRVNDYLGSAENQREIQEKVNKVVDAGEKVVRGFAGAFETLNRVIGPVADALGGLDRVVQAVLILGILRKAQLALGGVRGLAAGFGLVGPAALRAEATSVGALGGIGAAATGASGKVAGLRGQLGRLAGLGPIAISFALMQPDIIPSGGGEPGTITTGNDFPGLLRMAREGRLPISTINTLEKRGLITPTQAKQLRQAQRTPQRTGEVASPDRFDPRAPGAKPAPTSTGEGGADGGEGGTGAGGITEEDLLLDVARPGNEMADLRRLRSFYARQVRALEARKRLSEEQKRELRDLYGKLAGVQADIDAIIDAEEEKRREKAERAREKARERARREAAALERHNREAEEQERRILRSGAPRPGRGAAQVGSGTGKGFVRRSPQGKDEQLFTLEQIRSMQFEFLTSLQSTLGEYGSNIQTDGGQVATNSHVQTALMREQNRLIGRLAAGARQPAARYGTRVMTAAMDGYSF